MKQFILGVVLFSPFSLLFAFPAVGDFSILEGTAINAGVTHKGKLSYELLSYDTSKSAFELSTKSYLDEQIHEQKTEWVNEEGVFNPETASQILKNCAAFGGVGEQVTVPTGTYQTCKIRTEGLYLRGIGYGTNGYVWIANVPFGAVKYVGTTTDANGTTDFDLVLTKVSN